MRFKKGENNMLVLEEFFWILDEEMAHKKAMISHYNLLAKNFRKFIEDLHDIDFLLVHPQIFADYPELFGFGLKIMEYKQELERLEFIKMETIKEGRIILDIGVIIDAGDINN